MIEFKRNENGILEAYENGKKIGTITTMGDEVKSDERISEAKRDESRR